MRGRARRGFTLLELIVATAILAIGLVGVMQTISQGFNTSRWATDRTLGVELAEQKLAELTMDPELTTGDEEGDFGDDYPRYRWLARAETTDLDELLRLTVTVTWTSGASEHSVDIETCYAPQALSEDVGETSGTAGAGGAGML